MYYFDPDFGYIHVTGDAGTVRYGRGPIVPHDPASLADQRYTQFSHWLPIEQHYIPDEWLVAFGRYPPVEKAVVISDGPSDWNFGWAEWIVLTPWLIFLLYIVLKL